MEVVRPVGESEERKETPDHAGSSENPAGPHAANSGFTRTQPLGGGGTHRRDPPTPPHPTLQESRATPGGGQPPPVPGGSRIDPSLQPNIRDGESATRPADRGQGLLARAVFFSNRTHSPLPWRAIHL